MFLLYKICFIILFRENYSLKDTLHKKNLQLVEILKEDLQRNNDDYAGMRRNLSQTNSNQQSLNVNDSKYKIITTRDNRKVTKSFQSNNKENYMEFKETASQNGYNKTDKEDVRIKIIDNIRRRVNDALISKEVVNNDTVPQRRVGKPNSERTFVDVNSAKLLWNNMHDKLLNHNKLNQYRMQLLLNKTKRLTTPTTTATTTPKTTTISTTVKSKRDKKSKMMKLKKFIEKNKGLLKEFISSKRLATGISPATPATQRQKQLKLSGRQRNNILREDINSSIKNNLMELPNADMLDMFPAKGGRIHSKRVNGHLCHRHVLIPEGPKYNSEGRIYLPPHAAAHVAHEYNATEIPALLLPKCCNCCHKSVLGCE